jgi:CRP-like cAMP-binding protein
MTIEDDIAFLEGIPSLRLLGRDALRILAIGAESRTIREGISLFGEGEDADCAYVVQEGSFDLAAEKGMTPSSSVAGPGTLIDELALFTGAKRTTSAVAREPSTVVRIPRQLFLKMLEGYPDAARRMRDAIAAKVSRTAAELSRVRSTLVREPSRR